MIKKVGLALVLSFAGLFGSGAFGHLAQAEVTLGPFYPAQGTPVDQCDTTFPSPAPANPAAGNPYQISNCGQENSIFLGGGFCNNGACTDPYQDPAGVGVHWVGTAGSYAHFLCIVPSIVTGTEYATYSSAELDVLTAANSKVLQIYLQCSVQTPDRPGANLYATLATGEACYNESNYQPDTQGYQNNNFTVTENATGLVTLHCTFSSPFVY